MSWKRIAFGLCFGASATALAAASQAAAISGAAARVTPAAATESTNFNVYFPIRNQAALTTLLADLKNPSSPNYRKWLTPAQFDAQFGPTAASVANVTKALTAQGLTVTGRSGLAMQVSGPVVAVSRTLGTTLSHVQTTSGPSRLVANAAVSLPSALQAEGAKVIAFSGRPAMHTHAQQVAGKFTGDNRYGTAGPYWFTDLKQVYDYPSYQSLDGTGVGVAVVIPSPVLDSDIAAVFNHEHFTAITHKPVPTVTTVPLTVNGRAPGTFSPTGANSFEASLDVQEVLGGAPGAQVTVLDIPDLQDDAIMAAYTYAVAHPDLYQLVNSSFGGCELFYTSPAYGGGPGAAGENTLDAFNALFQQGNAEGITFVASSGDSGGLECPDANYLSGSPTAASRFVAGIEFPASSPFVTAVGGTNVVTAATGSTPPFNVPYGSENGMGDPETAQDPYGVGRLVYGGYWGAGGGVSSYYPKSPAAAGVNTGSTFRTVPDVGMQVGGCPGGISVLPCGPNRSAVVIADGYASKGYFNGVIGTSVSSPEFVGALALYVQRTGKGVGDVNGLLYTKGAAQTAGLSTSYHRNIPGFDGKYLNTYPSTNYNYIVGNGTPIVRQLFDMTDLPSAGPPQTAGNP